MRIPPAMLCLGLIVGLLAAGPPARAEPIALRTIESAQDDPLAGIELPQSESGPSVEFDGGEVGTDDATAPPPEQLPGDRRAAPTRRRAGQPRSAQAANAAREISSSANLAVTMDAEADWEREIREAMRPYYEQIAMSGVVDAVHGLKSYLSAGAAVPTDDEERTDYRTPSEIAPWESRDGRFDALGREKSPAQIENERKITAQLIDEWIAELKPWVFGLAALYALWHVIKLGFDFSRWRSERALKRGAKKAHGHRTTHGRHAPRRY